MKELIATFLLSFFIAETAQAIASKALDNNLITTELEILHSDLE